MREEGGCGSDLMCSFEGKVAGLGEEEVVVGGWALRDEWG